MHGDLEIVDDVADAFAGLVQRAYATRPDTGFALGLSGGETARRCYERLAADGTGIDWWNVDIYWGDERDVPLDHPDSNYRLGREALLDRVGGCNAHYPMRCDEGPDPYQLLIGEMGKFDLLHLGLGADGHTASLFPGSSGLHADPGRLVVMNEDPAGRHPYRRMTLTFAGIARARLAVVTVSGPDKREPLQRLRAGAEDLPAAHIAAEHVVWLVDRAAAGDR